MTTKKVIDEYDLEEGLPDDFDFWITRSTFGHRDNYQEGKATLLIWEGESPDVTLKDPIIWSIGRDWETDTTGRFAHHENGDDKRFNKSSIYGKALERMIELYVSEAGGDKEKAKDKMRELIPSPKDASSWVGVGLHLRRETLHFGGNNAEGGMRSSTEHLMPVAILGRKASGKAAAKPAAAPARVATPAASAPKANILRAKLTLLAKKNDFNAFIDSAMNDPQVAEDTDLLAEVIDDSDQGFWAKANA